jgi:hypothetical protein
MAREGTGIGFKNRRRRLFQLLEKQTARNIT